LHPHAFHASGENVAVDGVAITEQVLGCGLFREGLDKLLGGPHGGWSVTLTWRNVRRWWWRTTDPKSRRKVRVGTTKKSMAAISWQCVARKARQLGEGRGDRRRMYLAIVSSATSWPRKRSSA